MNSKPLVNLRQHIVYNETAARLIFFNENAFCRVPFYLYYPVGNSSYEHVTTFIRSSFLAWILSHNMASRPIVRRLLSEHSTTSPIPLGV